MPTQYKPFDGDYIDADYEKFLNDIQAQSNYEFGEYPEICVSLENDITIRILFSNDEKDEWIFDRTFPIPNGWDVSQVEKMFEGNVYLKPSYIRPELSEEDKATAERDCKKLIQKYGYNNLPKILAALAVENIRLVKEINEHRAARGIEPLPTFEV